MLDFMNEMTELIYVVDLQTYELLYANYASKRMFGLQEVSGLKCYKALQGFDAPCPFCTNAHLKKDSFYIWERTNTVTNRHYLLKDKIIDWNGREARLEIAFDMTQKENQNIELKNTLKAEYLIMDCVKILHACTCLPVAIHQILEKIGSFLEADRAYLFEKKNGQYHNTIEWCAQGVAPQIENLQELDSALFDNWREVFQKEGCIVIQDTGLLKNSELQQYELLYGKKIHSLVAFPLEIGGDLIGYIGVDNPPEEKVKNISALLQTLSYFIVSSMQATKNKQLLETLSYVDTLTQAYNRNAFTRDMEISSQAVAERTGVIYMDINGMKEMNDIHGHLYGDYILSNAAEIIFKLFPEQNCYRIGGDEFVVVCRNMSVSDFEVSVWNLKNTFGECKEYTVSVGFCFKEENAGLQTLIYEANEMMYAEKRKFYRGKALSKRYRHGNDDVLGLTKPNVLQKMLDSNRFLIYFQPKVSTKTYELIGAEALIRCRMPDGAIVPPGNFIPVLEEARLISLLDFYVFERVCERLDKWCREKKQRVPISVNFSRHTLFTERFQEHLYAVWGRFQIPQNLIEIEITESVEEDDNEKFLSVIKQMREAGFSISIDDFGVKNANLSLFTTVDFDVLKIDKSLIDNLADSMKSQAVIQSIVDVCKKVGVKMIAEGVETEEQLHILKKMDCQGSQGYLFSRPLPLEEFEKKFLKV